MQHTPLQRRQPLVAALSIVSMVILASIALGPAAQGDSSVSVSVSGHIKCPVEEKCPVEIPGASEPVETYSPALASSQLLQEALGVHGKIQFKQHVPGVGNAGLKIDVEADAGMGNGPIPATGGDELAGSIPCSDVRGCPDLIVDVGDLRRSVVYNLAYFRPNSCSVVEGSVAEPGTRRLMRFTFTSPNIGEGDLIVGRPADHPEWFEYALCHNHYHLKEYADYRLWTIEGYANWVAVRSQFPDSSPEQVFEAYPSLLDEFVAGHKQGFCVVDIKLYAPVPGTKEVPTYRSCSNNQGISVGYADVYDASLDGQWIDITGVEAGLYVLEAEVNAEWFYKESDYTNNAAATIVPVPPCTDGNPHVSFRCP